MLPPSAKKPTNSARSPAILMGLGALVLVAVGAAFLTMNRSAPHVAQEAAAPPPVQLARPMEGKTAQTAKVTGTPKPAVVQAGGQCPPGDPLCGDTDDLAPAPGGIARPKSPSTFTLEGEVALDPNGRFATTYRPGGGHLSAFEAAVSQGLLPPADRELVADVGARYTPPMEVPKDKALAMKFDWERAKLQPGGGPIHLRIALRSSADAPAARPHLSVHLVLDVSGSMAGKPMEQARKAAQVLVDRLAATDDFSLVTFSTDARVVVPDGPVGTRREQIKKTIEEIQEGGGTNIGAGLELGYQQARSKGIPEDAVKVVLLLSDGRANEGIVLPGQLAKLALEAFQDGIQTSSFGLGTDYDGSLMSAIAADGAGGYYYLRDSEQIAPALTTELDKRVDPVATGVEIRIRLKPNVELLKVYGSRRLSEAEAAVVRSQEIAADKQAHKRDKIKENRTTDQEGGLRLFFPAFARDDCHAMLFKLRLPEGVGSKSVALLEVKYKDRLTRKNASEEFPLTLTYAASDAESGGSIDPSVARTVQGFLAGETLAQASFLVAQGNRLEAIQMLAEREGILREAAAALSEPLFLRDADRLARLQTQVRGKGDSGDPLVLAMLLEAAAIAHLR